MFESRLSTAVVAVVVVGAASLVPGLGFFILAPLAALLIGAVAAYRTASRTDYSSTSAGLGSALSAGFGALLGTAVFIAVAALALGSVPEIQEFVRASEPHVEAQIPYEWIAPLAAVLGAFVGLLLGLMNLCVAAVGGLIGALVGAQRPDTASRSVAR